MRNLIAPTLVAFILILNCYADVSFNSRIDIAEYEAKYSKSSWCVTTDGWSKTGKSASEISLNGNNQDTVQSWSKHGKNYLARKIKWDSETTTKTFKLDFFATNANMSGSHQHDDRRCSYKYWEGKIASAKNTLNANAAFKIPKNVWVVKINSNYTDNRDTATIKLYNNDYEKTVIEDGTINQELKKAAFESFSNGKNSSYYLVNPSVDEFDNHVFLHFQKAQKDSGGIQLSYSFDVEFLAQEKCLKDLEGQSLQEILWNSGTKGSIDESIEKLACMLAPQYIKHVLSNLYFHGINDFYKSLDKLEKHYEDEALINDKHLKRLIIVQNLLDKIRFYYTFELTKDLMNLISYVSEDGLNGLQVIDTLKHGSMSYINGLIAELLNTIRKAKRNNQQLILKLTSRDLIILDTLGKKILGLETTYLTKTIAELPMPQIISSNHFYQLRRSVERFSDAYRSFNSQLTNILNPKVSLTTNALDMIEQDLLFFLQGLENYTISWEKFRDNMISSGNNSTEMVFEQRKFIDEIELLYQLNVKGLRKIVGEYFVKHFENKDFKLITVNDKSYDNIDDFLAEFDSVLGTANEK